MRSVCEFKLNYTKIHNLGIFGTPVPVHLRPVPVQVAFCWPVPVQVGPVPVQVGPVPVQVGLWWVVSVQPCTCTGTPSEICPELLLFATFCTNSLHTTSPFLNSSRTNMEFISNNFITLELVIWNSYHKTLGKNPMNSPKGPPILLNTIKI